MHFAMLLILDHIFLCNDTVVTVDGIMIKKNGNMVGGISRGIEARAERWNQKEIDSMSSILSYLVNGTSLTLWYFFTASSYQN